MWTLHALSASWSPWRPGDQHRLTNRLRVFIHDLDDGRTVFNNSVQISRYSPIDVRFVDDEQSLTAILVVRRPLGRRRRRRRGEKSARENSSTTPTSSPSSGADVTRRLGRRTGGTRRWSGASLAPRQVEIESGGFGGVHFGLKLFGFAFVRLRDSAQTVEQQVSNGLDGRIIKSNGRRRAARAPPSGRFRRRRATTRTD